MGCAGKDGEVERMMERITFDGNFCDISQCLEPPCQHGGNCSQKQVWERLKEYEDTGLTPEDCARAAEIDDILLDEYYPIGRMRNLIKADKEGRVIVLPAVRYCEQYGWQNITWDEKYGVCAGSWNTCEEAEKALEAMKDA